MLANALICYALGTASILSACAAAILNGLCYATSKSLSSDSPAIELAIVGLHAMSCVELVVLVLLLGRDVSSGLAEWTGFKNGICWCVGTFLFITTAATAGATAWRDSQSTTHLERSQPLLLSQCIIWAVSVFNQGLFCGFLLIAASKKEHRHSWRCSFQEDMEARNSPSAKRKGRLLPSLHYDSRIPYSPTNSNATPDEMSPVRSFAANVGSQVLNRYSGGTLFQQDSRRSSVDLVSPESPTLCVRKHIRQASHGTCSRRSGSHPRKRQKSHSEVKRSLDGVILQPSSPGPGPSSPLTSSPTTDPAKPRPSKRNAPSENHIHPLFRTGSASPPPTPAPGTMVTASPVAGQTISAKMLSKVRSSYPVQVNGERSKSPLTESGGSYEEVFQEPEWTGGRGPRILATEFWRGGSRQEREYSLCESPHET